ncbi:MAG: type II secretion system protein M [Nitrospinota bacterium]|nr:type II secretion system protein M [Nitrospinota bacterium]
MSRYGSADLGGGGLQGISSRLRAILAPLTERLDKLPERDKKVIVLGGAISALILLYSFLIDPLYIRYGEIKNEVIRTTEKVERFRSVLETTEENQGKREEYTREFESALRLCFEGETESIAAGKLAETARDIASEIGLVLKSTKVENSVIVPGFRTLNVAISFDASFPSLLRFTQKIGESGRKIMIKDAKIHSLRETYPSNQEEILSVELILSGLQYVQ